MCTLRCINGGAGILACLCRTFLSGRIGSRSTACRGRKECLPHRAPPKEHEPNAQRSTFNAESHPPKKVRRGYVLIVTLALLVLSATVMVGVARMAIRQTSLARQAQDDLQQHWGVASIR